MASYTVYKCKGCDRGFIATERTVDYYDYVSVEVYGCKWCGYSDSLQGETVASGEGSIPKKFTDKMYFAGVAAAYGPYGGACDTDMFGRTVGNIQREPPKPNNR